MKKQNLKTPSFRPCCPNHGEPLVDIPFPMPAKGIGICPVSGFSFEYEVELDEDKIIKDKDGNLSKATKWKVDGQEK